MKKGIVKRERKPKALPPAIIQPSAAAPLPARTGAEAMIAMAIDKNLDIDKLKELIELRNQEEARAAKKEFMARFADMQRDYVPAMKSKKVLSGGKVLYAYCPLEEILVVYQPILSRHGFSYHWEEESIHEGKEIRVTCIVAGYGHEERTPVEIPLMAATSFTNGTQQRGSASSYGKRYSLMSALGIIVAGEDNDAQCVETVKESSIPRKAERVVTEEKKTLPKFTQAMQGLNAVPDVQKRIGLAHLINKHKGSDAALDVVIEFLGKPARMKSASLVQEIEAAIAGRKA